MSQNYLTPVLTSDGPGALRTAATKKDSKYKFTEGTATFVGKYAREIESSQGLKYHLSFLDGKTWTILAQDCMEVEEPDVTLTRSPNAQIIVGAAFSSK